MTSETALPTTPTDPDDPWHDADAEHVGPGGDVGGDAQAGESHSVRYIRDDQPGALITEYYYAAVHQSDDDHDGPFHLCMQVEYLTCTDPDDPGGTETWSETEYTDFDRDYETLAEADAAALNCAQNSRPYPHRDWDGTEPDSGRIAS